MRVAPNSGSSFVRMVTLPSITPSLDPQYRFAALRLQGIYFTSPKTQEILKIYSKDFIFLIRDLQIINNAQDFQKMACNRSSIFKVAKNRSLHLIIDCSPQQITYYVQHILQLFAILGLKINEQKSSIVPTQKIVEGSTSTLHNSESIPTLGQIWSHGRSQKSITKATSDHSKNVSEIIAWHGLMHIHSSICQISPSLYARMAEIYYLPGKHHINMPVHIPTRVLKSLDTWRIPFTYARVLLFSAFKDNRDQCFQPQLGSMSKSTSFSGFMAPRGESSSY